MSSPQCGRFLCKKRELTNDGSADLLHLGDAARPQPVNNLFTEGEASRSCDNPFQVPRQICDPLSGLDAIAHLKGLISMKKLLTIAVATTALVSVPAFAADTDTVDLLVHATVLVECSIENPTDVTFATDRKSTRLNSSH